QAPTLEVPATALLFMLHAADPFMPVKTWRGPQLYEHFSLRLVSRRWCALLPNSPVSPRLDWVIQSASSVRLVSASSIALIVLGGQGDEPLGRADRIGLLPATSFANLRA